MGCTFPYTTGVTFGSPTATIQYRKLDGIVFDFGGNYAGLTMTGLKYGTYRIQIQNTGTAAGLALTGSNTKLMNFWWNSFPYLHIIDAGIGVLLDRDANIGSCGGSQLNAGAVYRNQFGFMFLESITGATGLSSLPARTGILSHFRWCKNPR